MRKKSKVIADKPNFETLIPEYSDEEILNILKKRKHYQPEAAELAVQEAIKRGIIHSEQDLFAPEFKVEPLKNTIFPVIENENSRQKIIKSISRSLLIPGLIPVIYGFLKIKEGNGFEGGILTLGGLLWIFLAGQLLRKPSLQIVNSFFFLVLISAIYLIKLLFLTGSFVLLDVFIFIAFYGLLIYGLLFLRRLF